MRLCNNCQRITIGDPLFCSNCGRTYDVKLCPHRHSNPRNARVCSQCGSADLSTPQPKASFWIRPVIFLLSFLPGLILLLVSLLFLVGLLRALIGNPELLGRFLFVGMLLALLWLIYMQLPGPIRKSVHRLFGGSKSKDISDGH
jgi:hypothetical protein